MRSDTGSLDSWGARIARVRAELLQRSDILAGDRTIGQHVQLGSVPPDVGDSLYRLARKCRPRSIVELGTSVGLSGSYLVAGLADLGGSRLITLERFPQLATVARETFDRLGLGSQVDIRVGLFDDELDRALIDAEPVDLMFVDGHHQAAATVEYLDRSLPHLSRNAVVIFDDIDWSDDMRQCWQQLRSHPRTGFTNVVGRMGLWTASDADSDHPAVAFARGARSHAD